MAGRSHIETERSNISRTVARGRGDAGAPEVQRVQHGAACDRPGPVVALVGRECGADVDVRVPPGVRVSAVTGAGHIAVRGVTGDLDLRTGSGGVQVADVRGRLRLQARSGAITATGLASPKVVAEASSGSLELRFAEPPDVVTAAVRSGSARVIVPPGSQYAARIRPPRRASRSRSWINGNYAIEGPEVEKFVEDEYKGSVLIAS